jgi:hypothetical protein
VLGCYAMQLPALMLAEFNTCMHQTATTIGHGCSSMAFGVLLVSRYHNWPWRRVLWRKHGTEWQHVCDPAQGLGAQRTMLVARRRNTSGSGPKRSRGEHPSKRVGAGPLPGKHARDWAR